MSNTASLKEVISQCHCDINELFLLHQEAVLLGEFEKAIGLLNCYKEAHHLHMDFEDQYLIPEFQQIDQKSRWPASLYSAEHDKIQKFMTRIEGSLEALKKGNLTDQQTRRNMIALLDFEKTFKGYCDHHQDREEDGMLPDLDERTDKAWRMSIIKVFQEKWNDLMASINKETKNRI